MWQARPATSRFRCARNRATSTSTRCINCGRCAEVCPVELPDNYQQGMATRKAVYKVAARAAPDAYVIDRGPYCDDCRKCVDVCPSRRIDLDEQPRLLTVEVGAIILAWASRFTIRPAWWNWATAAIPTCSRDAV